MECDGAFNIGCSFIGTMEDIGHSWFHFCYPGQGNDIISTIKRDFAYFIELVKARVIIFVEVTTLRYTDGAIFSLGVDGAVYLQSLDRRINTCVGIPEIIGAIC